MSGSGSCRDQYDSVLDNQPNTTTTNDDPLLTAAETAWLEYAKGTYSNTDKRIFIEGFRRGWQSHSEYLDIGESRHRRRQIPTEAKLVRDEF